MTSALRRRQFPMATFTFAREALCIVLANNPVGAYTWYLVLCALYSVSRTRVQSTVQTKYRAPSTAHRLQSTKHKVQSTKTKFSCHKREGVGVYSLERLNRLILSGISCV